MLIIVFTPHYCFSNGPSSASFNLISFFLFFCLLNVPGLSTAHNPMEAVYSWTLNLISDFEAFSLIKTVSGIQTRIVGEEGEHADHWTTTTTKTCLST